jgi:short-subunit dehydrogenase
MRNLKQRYGDWALITGGTSGIGAALAEELAKEGLNLVIVARNETALKNKALQLSSNFRVQVLPLAVDLSTAGGLENLLNFTKELDIGVVVPCAAIETQGYFVQSNGVKENTMIQMNVVAPMTIARHYGAAMAQRGRGAILFVSSLSGWMPQPYMAHYGGCKSFIMGLGAGLHFEMKDKGVDVSILSPGPTDTPMAAATGIDFASMGMSVMSPQAVAACGLDALGRKLDAVPGLRNKIMAFMMSRLMSRGMAGAMFKMMMGKALKITS